MRGVGLIGSDDGNEPTYSVSWMMLIRPTKGIKEGHAKIYEEIYGGGFLL